MRHRPSSAGFTLLELLIAVAVLAIAMAALIGSFGRFAEQASYLRQRTQATWVAHNLLTEQMLRVDWPATGEKSDETTLAEQVWDYRLTVSTTDDRELRRVEVKVYAQGVDADKAESPTAASLTGFISCVAKGGGC